MTYFVPDPEYDLIPAREITKKRGQQCGKCGAKFEYGYAYTYCCTSEGCPMNGHMRDFNRFASAHVGTTSP